MYDIIFGGRDIVKIQHTELLKLIGNVLEAEAKEEYDIALSELEDDMAQYMDNSNVYNIYNDKLAITLRPILIKFGIVVTEKITYGNYITLFNMLYSIKNNGDYNDQVYTIISGDFHEEDKLYMLLGLYGDDDFMDSIETSPLLFSIIEEWVTIATIELNETMILRAFDINSVTGVFKTTMLFKDITQNICNIMLDTMTDFDLITNELKRRLEAIKINKNYMLESLTNEIAYTFIYYSVEKDIDILKITNQNYLERLLDRDLKNDTITINIIKRTLNEFSKDL